MFCISEVQLSYTPKFKRSELPIISEARDAYNVLLEHWDMKTINLIEHFYVLLLSRSNKLLGIYEVSKGGFAGTVVDPKIIFIAALKGCASTIILAHNHPSGNLKPSQSDISITKRLIEAGRILDLPVVDHLIVTEDGYLSFAEEGLL
ncbi:DNA repair protein RadC [Daejeonella rubra]|uniref:DNA repair protein RadC n=1 Tax=Daejeonella rubra TaxID=990371 RepID=A0A1G9MAG9_9SPHI|nr:JAB domain-containing protein [Daejeonella rubra]SDL70665.1 DNA repair protein RadC [Daejeonella rubra]